MILNRIIGFLIGFQAQRIMLFFGVCKKLYTRFTILKNSMEAALRMHTRRGDFLRHELFYKNQRQILGSNKRETFSRAKTAKTITWLESSKSRKKPSKMIGQIPAHWEKFENMTASQYILIYN